LNLTINEKIIGFLYLGTTSDSQKKKTVQLNPSEYFENWPV